MSPTKASPATPATPVYNKNTPGQHLDPHDAHKALNRRSVASLLPGPLTSPLSSSLSAIVADSLRRGVDQLPTPTLRRRSARLKRRPTDAAKKRHSIASGEMNFEDDELDDDDPRRASAGSPTPRRPGGVDGRVRSLSATLGDYFGSQKRQRGESLPEHREGNDEDR